MGSSSCSDCALGYRTAGGGANTHSSCAQCPAGNTCDGGSGAVECVAGTYATIGASTCTDCNSDTMYSTGTGNNQCTLCAAGSFTSGGTSQTRSACSACVAGNSCDGSHTQTACSAGSFSGAGASFCTQCGSDTKHSQAGQATACKDCAVGSYTSGGGINSHTHCLSCTPGHRCDGSSTLTACTAGTFAAAGAATCSDCGGDKKYSGLKASSCSTCTPKSYTTGGATNTHHGCASCAAGWQCDGSSTPAPCGDDTKYSAASASTCATCAPGSRTIGGTTNTHTGCTQCTAGYMCGGSSTQTPCLAGKFSSAGAATCEECGASNKYNALTTQETCKTCPYESYTFGGGPSTRFFCDPCPIGSWCDGSSIIKTPSAECVCSDSCATQGNGVCEDGGPGSAASTCASGSDCGDCGNRCPLFTLECPAGWNYKHMERYDVTGVTLGGTYGHFCYRAVDPIAAATFSTADKECQSINAWDKDRVAHLATPLSETEWSFVASLCRGDTCWIGFTDDTMSGGQQSRTGPVSTMPDLTTCCANTDAATCTASPSLSPRNGPWWGVDGSIGNGNLVTAVGGSGQCQTDIIDTSGGGSARQMAVDVTKWSGPWSSGKPSDDWLSAPGGTLGCVHCYDGCSKWEDTSCLYSRAFVCKMPANIPAGHRNKGSAPISTKFGQNFDIVKCPKGTYNSDVQPPSFVACKNCAAGKFGDTEGLGKEACSGACAAGYYCKEGSTTNKYAPCLAGTYGSSQGLKTSACDGLCPAGYWCAAGSVSATATMCRAGYYGDSLGMSSDTCTGKCPAGYHCPAGTSSSTSRPCTDAATYCPEASAAPVHVPLGFYSIDSRGDAVQESGLNAVNIKSCETGKWCANGRWNVCPAGTYGASLGLQTTACSGDCTAGYFCAKGSTSALSEACGSVADASKGETPATFFCPAGSATPTRVSTGHYTACDNAGSLLCSETLRTDQIPCESGLLCVGGYQRRAIEWPPGLCTCTFSTHPTTGATVDTCVPAAPWTVDFKVVLPEQPRQLTVPYGVDGARQWGETIAAQWFDSIGTAHAVTNMVIKNLARNDASPGSLLKPCTISSSSSSSSSSSAVPLFALVPKPGGVGGAGWSLDFLLDYESCEGWSFDLVATSGDPGVGGGGTAPPPTSTCKFVVTVDNENDAPYWNEGVTGGNRYGVSITGGSPVLSDTRTVSEKAAANTIVTRVRAKDDDASQEIEYAIVGGNEGDMFRINSCSGDIYVYRGGIDYTVQSFYTLRIQVKDVASIFPASLAIGITNVNIQVVDVNDAPIICSGEATTPTSSQKYGNCTQHVVDGKLEMYEDASPLIDSTIPQVTVIGCNRLF